MNKFIVPAAALIAMLVVFALIYLQRQPAQLETPESPPGTEQQPSAVQAEQPEIRYPVTEIARQRSNAEPK